MGELPLERVTPSSVFARGAVSDQVWAREKAYCLEGIHLSLCVPRCKSRAPGTSVRSDHWVLHSCPAQIRSSSIPYMEWPWDKLRRSKPGIERVQCLSNSLGYPLSHIRVLLWSSHNFEVHSWEMAPFRWTLGVGRKRCQEPLKARHFSCEVVVQRIYNCPNTSWGMPQ